MSRTLTEIEAAGAALDALIAELDGDVSDGAAEIVDAWFAELQEETARKVDGYAFRIKAEEADAERWAAMAAEMSAKADAAKSRAKRLKERMAFHLETQQLQEIKGEIYRFYWQKNGGKAPLIMDSTDPNDFPPECRVTTVSISNAKVRELVDAGLMEFTEFEHDDNGVQTERKRKLPAHLGERGRSLRLA